MNNFNMQEVEVDRKVMKKSDIKLSRIKRQILKHVWGLRLLGVLAFVLFVAFLFFVGRSFLTSLAGQENYSLAKNFIFPDESIVHSVNGRTNLLILGKGGVGHDAPDLTDTVMFVSIPQTKGEVFVFSLPRDIWIQELRAKLNSVYYWGNQKEDRGGIVLVKSVVEEIVGLPVHYAVVVDFSIFKSVIDELGGVEVEVERGFVDEKYPIKGKEDDLCNGDLEYSCRYETIEFVSGLQFMDGETALKFVRSRNANGDEGTDLARSARQERVMFVIKEKVLQREFLFRPKKVIKLKNVVLEKLETDLNEDQMAVLARKIYGSKDSVSLYTVPEEFLEVPQKSSLYDLLYVFIPKSGSWEELQSWIEEKL